MHAPLHHRSRIAGWPRPAVALCLVLLVVLLGWWARSCLTSGAGVAAKPTLTVAVLPFEGDGTPVIDTVATGLAADLQTRLQLLEHLQCVPRALVRRMADPSLSAPELGRRLGAEVLIHGRTNVSGGQIALTLVVEPTTVDQPASTFELIESAEAVLDLERRVIRQVTDAIGVPVSWRERRWITSDSTRSIKAWDYASQGFAYLESPTSIGRAANFAADLFRSALQLDPGYSEARSGLGEALWRQFLLVPLDSSLELAESQAEQALEANPRRSTAAVTLAKIRLWRSLPQRPDWDRVLDLDPLPKADEAWRQLAVELRQVGELGMAESAWQQAVSVANPHWIDWYGLASFLERSGRFAEAEKAYRQADSRTPARVHWARLNILRLQLATHQTEAALDTYTSLGPEAVADADTLALVAAALADEERWIESEAALQRAWQLRPASLDLALRFGKALLRTGESRAAEDAFAQALDLAESQLERSPEDSALQLRVAVAAAYSGDCQRALPLATNLRHAKTESADRYHSLAQAFAVCGQDGPALEALRQAFALGLPMTTVVDDPVFDGLIDDPVLHTIEPAPGTPPTSH